MPDPRTDSHQEPTTNRDVPCLSLCVVNFNGARYLRDTLSAVRAIGTQFIDMVLVDNASTDHGLAIAESMLPGLTVVRLRQNRGPGAARNEGLRRARSSRVLFIDNDVVLDPDCPRRLQERLNRSLGAVVAVPRVLFAHDPGTVQFDGAGSHFVGLLTLRNAGAPHAPLDAGQARRSGYRHSEGETPDADNGSLISACFLLDRARWGDAPLFDEALTMYLEDHEAGLRIRLLGHRIVSVPEALCYHGLGTPGLSIRDLGRHHPVRIEGTILNRWQLILKLYSLRTLVLLLPALVVFEVFQLIGALGKGWLGDWRRAAGCLIRNLPSLVRRRRAFQATRRLPDGAVLEGGPIPFNPSTHATPLQRLGGTMLDAMTEANWRLVRRFLGTGEGGAHEREPASRS